MTTSTTMSTSRAKSLAPSSVHRYTEISGRLKESVPSLRLRLTKCTSTPVETRMHGWAGRAAPSRMASVRVTSRCPGVPLGQKMTFPSMTSISLRT